MKYLALTALAALGFLTAAMPSTVVFNEQFAPEQRTTMNAAVGCWPSTVPKTYRPI